jgi:hypothetical protein
MRHLHLLDSASLSPENKHPVICKNCGRLLLITTDKEVSPLYTTIADDFWRAPMEARCSPLTVTDTELRDTNGEAKTSIVRTSIK